MYSQKPLLISFLLRFLTDYSSWINTQIENLSKIMFNLVKVKKKSNLIEKEKHNTTYCCNYSLSWGDHCPKNFNISILISHADCIRRVVLDGYHYCNYLLCWGDHCPENFNNSTPKSHAACICSGTRWYIHVSLDEKGNPKQMCRYYSKVSY